MIPSQNDKVLPEIYKKSFIKKELNFDMFLAQCVERIDMSSVENIKRIREELKTELLTIDIQSKKEISNKIKYFLREKRRIVTKALAHTKERLRLINLVVCNSVSLNTAERFFRTAAQILPAADFQNILGKCMTEESIENDKLGFIKEFMKDLNVGNR